MLLKCLLPFLQEDPSLALFALLATASSGFGQTFLIGLFGDPLRSAFDLSHSAYGLIYSLATLCSAALLLSFGSLLDNWSLRRVTLLAIGVLSAGCFGGSPVHRYSTVLSPGGDYRPERLESRSVRARVYQLWGRTPVEPVKGRYIDRPSRGPEIDTGCSDAPVSPPAVAWLERCRLDALVFPWSAWS